MSLANYELWYLDDVGNRLAYIGDAKQFEYTKVLGSIGVGSVTIPQRGQIYDNTTIDRRIAFYLQPENGSLTLDFVMMARRFVTSTTTEGQYQLLIQGADFNELLERRIVAYYASSAEALATGTADDLMKKVARENFVDNADYSGTPSPTRSITAQGFSVQADATAGPSLTMGYSWKSALTVCNNLQAASKKAANEVFFAVEPTSETTMEFRTWTGGNDRTVTTGTNPIVFSLEWGNLANPSLADDSSGEANYVYGAGQGTESGRIIQTASDTARINASQLNRRESLGYSNGKTDATVLADAENELERKRPFSTLTAEIHSTPLTPYGGANGWNLGTLVTVNYAGLQYDVRIRSVFLRVDAAGRLSVRGRVEAI